MGQQQLLLIILGVIIVGIAIAVGLQLFQAGSVGANQDGMVTDIMNISANADQWRIRPATMGGGDGVFTADIVSRLNANQALTQTANANYVITLTSADAIQIVGTHVEYGTVQLDYDFTGTTDAERYTWGGTHKGGIGG